MAKTRIPNSSVPVFEDFNTWLSTQVKATTANNYCSWLKNIIDDIKTHAPSVQLTQSEENFLDVVPALIQAGVFYKADIVCNLLEEHIDAAIKANNCPALNNDRSALQAYVRYIKSIVNAGGFSKSLSVPVPGYDELMPYRKELSHYPTNVAKGEFDKIDGIDALIDMFANNHGDFIRKVLGESYFFSPDLEKERFDELARELKSVSFARYSQEEYKTNGSNKAQVVNDSKVNPIVHTFKDGSGPFRIELDDDGNRRLRHIINDKTKYWISNGKDISQFVNFRISHLWGKAFDPRYFTSLWNVVVVPAWANDLLDKEYGYSSLVNEMKDTFKAVCISLYGMKAKQWTDICLSSMPNVEGHEVRGDYQVNVIEGKKGNFYGRIIAKTVKV